MSRASKCPKCYWAHLETRSDPEDCDEHPCSKGMPQTAYRQEYRHRLCPIFTLGKNPQVVEKEYRQRREGAIALGLVGGGVITPPLLRFIGLVSWSWEACFAPMIGIICMILFAGLILLACGHFNPVTVEDDA